MDLQITKGFIERYEDKKDITIQHVSEAELSKYSIAKNDGVVEVNNNDSVAIYTCRNAEIADIDCFSSLNFRKIKLDGIGLSASINKRHSLDRLFMNCINLETVDIKGLRTDEIKSMREMFKGCKKLQSAVMCDTANVEGIRGLFYNCKELIIPILILVSETLLNKGWERRDIQ